MCFRSHFLCNELHVDRVLSKYPCQSCDPASHVMWREIWGLRSVWGRLWAAVNSNCQRGLRFFWLDPADSVHWWLDPPSDNIQPHNGTVDAHRKNNTIFYRLCSLLILQHHNYAIEMFLFYFIEVLKRFEKSDMSHKWKIITKWPHCMGTSNTTLTDQWVVVHWDHCNKLSSRPMSSVQSWRNIPSLAVSGISAVWDNFCSAHKIMR